MNNLTPLRKEENPLIGLMERGEKPGAGGLAQPPSALDAKLRHSPNAKQRGHRGSYICPGAARPPRTELLLSSFPGAVSLGRQRGRRAGLGMVGDGRGWAPPWGRRCGQQGRFSVQGDLGFDGLGGFLSEFGVFLALGRLVAAYFPAWQGRLATHLSGQLPCLSPTCCAPDAANSAVILPSLCSDPIPAPSSQNSLSCLGMAQLIQGRSCSPAATHPRSTGISAIQWPGMHPPPLRSLGHPVLFCQKSGKYQDRAASGFLPHSSDQPRSNPSSVCCSRFAAVEQHCSQLRFLLAAVR